MNNEQFNFKYTALTEEEKKEIESIKRQYSNKEKTESKIDRLRRLDGLVKNTSIIVSLCLGIIGCLIFGLGLTTVLEWQKPLLGIIFAIVGVIPMILSYPVYKIILKKYKDKYGEEILRLSEELLNENKIEK